MYSQTACTGYQKDYISNNGVVREYLALASELINMKTAELFFKKTELHYIKVTQTDLLLSLHKFDLSKK